MTNRRSRGAAPEAPEPGAAPPSAPPVPERIADAQVERPEHDSGAQEETAQIEEVSARTGLTKRALRYYEEIGLLDRPTRTIGNYRQYTERDIARLESIKRWRELLGFSLAEIRELVSMEQERQETRDKWNRNNDARQRLELLDHSDDLARRTLEVVEEKIAGLEQTRAELRERLERHKRMRAELQAEVASQPAGANAIHEVHEVHEVHNDHLPQDGRHGTHGEASMPAREPAREPSDVR